MPTTQKPLVEKKKLEKSPLDLHYMGERVLRQPAKRVARVDDSIRKLVKEMLQTMYTSDGIGLAAPQIGIQKQILVLDSDWENPATPPLVLINPAIKKLNGPLTVAEEGCLSIPGVFLDVTRPSRVEVSYKDENGRPQKRVFDDLPSRIIQHEIDHLNGVLFVDRVDNELALTEALSKTEFSVRDVKAIR